MLEPDDWRGGQEIVKKGSGLRFPRTGRMQSHGMTLGAKAKYRVEAENSAAAAAAAVEANVAWHQQVHSLT